AFIQNILCSFLLAQKRTKKSRPSAGRKRYTASRDPLRSSGQAVFWEELRLNFSTTVVNNSGSLIGSKAA
ncbi:MAG: hypothetical protein JST58_05525, partial [Bacteroidetes bacterium]|nr:hypothetical protein [Bacteroidota bacterium]